MEHLRQQFCLKGIRSTYDQCPHLKADAQRFSSCQKLFFAPVFNHEQLRLDCHIPSEYPVLLWVSFEAKMKDWSLRARGSFQLPCFSACVLALDWYWLLARCQQMSWCDSGRACACQCCKQNVLNCQLASTNFCSLGYSADVLSAGQLSVTKAKGGLPSWASPENSDQKLCLKESFYWEAYVPVLWDRRSSWTSCQTWN